MGHAPTGRPLGAQASASSAGPPATAGRAPFDPVTGLCDWKAFHQSLREAALLATRTGAPLSLLMIDLSEAEAMAASRGARVVDELLRLAAHRLQALTHGQARLARYNGARFVMILPGANLAGAQAQAARLDTGLAAGSLFVGLLGQEAAASRAMIGAVQFRDDESLGLCLQRAADAASPTPSAERVAPAPDCAEPTA
jgi:diguanylate cyclase